MVACFSASSLTPYHSWSESAHCLTSKPEQLTKTEHEKLIATVVDAAPAWHFCPPAQEADPDKYFPNELQKERIVDFLWAQTALFHDLPQKRVDAVDDRKCHNIPAVVEVPCILVNLNLIV